MKCIVISDSHRSGENIGRALSKNPDAEVVFYLGDGISALDAYIERYPEKAWFYVLGNCDLPTVAGGSFCAKKIDSINLFGKKIVLTHGDLYGAKWGTGGLIKLAEEQGADVVLYGHTHIEKEEYISERGLWLFNPGSLEASFGKAPSFGLITLSEDGEMLFSHGTL